MARRKIKPAETKRKDDLDPAKDEFINKTTAALDWAYARRRPIALILGFVLVIAIVGLAANYFMESARADESTALAAGLDSALAPIIPHDEKQADLPHNHNHDHEAENETLSFEGPRERATETAKQFETAEGKTDSTLSLISTLGKAAALLDLGEYDKAISNYEKFLNSSGDELAFLRPVAIEGLGYALEAENKIDEAVSRFEKLKQESSGSAATMAQYQAARLALKKNDKEKAKQLLSDVMAAFKENGHMDNLNHVFLEARETLLALDPDAEVPPAPQTGFGGLEGIDPAILQQLMQAQAGGGAS